jgi:hypothetical protein
MEVDFDLHQYTYLARRAITSYIQRLEAVVWETAFVVQGNVPEELPEHIMAGSRMYRINLLKVCSLAPPATPR